LSQVARASLVFYVTDGASSSPQYCSTSVGWDQTTVTWSNALKCSSSLVGGGTDVANNVWFSYDVTSAYQSSASFRFVGTSGADFVANSSEASSNRPYLLVWTQK